MSVPIVIIGYRGEKVIEHLIRWKPKDTRAKVIYIDDILDDDKATIELGDENELIIRRKKKLIVPSNAAIYHRFFLRDEPTPARRARLGAIYAKFIAFIDLMHPAALVINRPRAGAHNFAKMAHLHALKTLGFDVPTAVQSTFPGDFDSLDGEWINKGGSGTRTIATAARRGQLPTEVNRLSPPVLMQTRINGPDVRVHFVGLRHVALSFSTDAVDYRYAEEEGKELTVEPVEIEPRLVSLCWDYLRRERLEFAGFDFKVDEHGQWFLLEVNPMPGFSFFDRHANHQISGLIWGTLRRGFSNTGPSARPQASLIGLDRRPRVDTGSR